MKRLLLLLSCSGALLYGADLTSLHTVYVMSMTRGLDQYLANQLTRERVFQVVTDPKLADAVLTDHLGANFQAQLEDISPTPEPVAAEPEKPEPESAKAGASGAKAAVEEEASAGGLLAPPVNKLASLATMSTFGGGKGVIFLVVSKSRQVVWSTFELPKSHSLRDMNRAAADIVERLKKDRNPKK
jgi:hypothetical protein